MPRGLSSACIRTIRRRSLSPPGAWQRWQPGPATSRPAARPGWTRWSRCGTNSSHSLIVLFLRQNQGLVARAFHLAEKVASLFVLFNRDDSRFHGQRTLAGHDAVLHLTG